MRWPRFLIAIGFLVLEGAPGLRAASDALPAKTEEAEESYELRLERLLRQKGHRALAEYLTREFRERPRPYVKAWYANYLLYGVEFGVNDIADPARGIALAQEAAAEGARFGEELVGRAWGDGRGTPTRNPETAVRWLRSAAEHGRSTAMVELGKFYFFGAGVPKDRGIAEEWMHKAACRGAHGGLFLLAEWSESALYLGAAPDLRKSQALYYRAAGFGNRDAARLLRERAEKGDSDAQKYAKLALVEGAVIGTGPLPARLREAVRWLDAQHPDDVPVQVALAQLMIEKTLPVYDPAAATEKLRRAVAAGDNHARYLQAMMVWAGVGQKADPRAAIATWRELAADGHARSLARLGWCHYWGNAEKHGVPKDPQQAFEYSKQAADAGDWFGQINTADCYSHGIGVPVNYFLAAKYFSMVEDRGSHHAARMKERILGYVKD